MSRDEMTPIDGTLHELSDQELDEVAGGLNLRISTARFRQKNSSSGSYRRKFGSSSESESIESAALQITITDATTEDLKILSALLGDAIDDD